MQQIECLVGKGRKCGETAQKPYKNKRREESVNRPLKSERWAKNPMKKQPTRFTMKVPKGKEMLFEKPWTKPLMR